MDLEQIQFKLKGEDMIRRLIKKTTFRIAFTALSACVVWQAKAADIKVVSDTPSILILSVTERYTLGDGDTLSDAKKINIENVKKSSADYSGTYVEKMIVVGGSNDDNKITEQQVRVLTSGFVEVVNRDDIRTIGDSGELNLTTTAKVKLSKKAIQDGLAKLKTDPVKAEKIAALERNNKMLVDELYKLTENINKGGERTDLVKKRSEIMSALNSNRVATQGIFNQGTLFQMAMMDKDEYASAKADLDDNFFGAIKSKTKVELGEPEFIDNGDGTFAMHMNISWKMPTGIENVLLKHFNTVNSRKNPLNLDGGRDFYLVEKRENMSNKKKAVYSPQLLDYLAAQYVMIEIDFGFGIKGYENIYKSSEGRPVSAYKVFAVAENTFIKPYITKSDLERFTSIKARVIVVDSKERRELYQIQLLKGIGD